MATSNSSIALAKKLTEAYNLGGEESVKRVAIKILQKSSKLAGKEGPHINGETCESLLMLLTKDYIKKKGIVAKCYQSLILRDLNSNSDIKSTENDMVLVSPSIVLTCEAKSYRGDITVLPKCTLHRSNGNDADVHKQCQSHLRDMFTCLKEFTVKGCGANIPIAAFCFLFSDGTITDNSNTRSDEDRIQLPVVTLSSLYSYYDLVFKHHSRQCYDYDKLVKVFDKLDRSVSAHEMHKSYVGY